jgi:hypothetical protein
MEQARRDYKGAHQATKQQSLRMLANLFSIALASEKYVHNIGL